MDKTKSVRSKRKTMGVFSTQQAAEQAKQHLSNLFSGDESKIAFITPGDPNVDLKLKDELTAMGSSGISVHIISIIVSLILGVAFWGFMYNAGSLMFVHEALISFMGVVCVFLLIGVIVGVLIAYTPSRNAVIAPVKNAVANGKWVIIAYPQSKEETAATIDYFNQLEATPS